MNESVCVWRSVRFKLFVYGAPGAGHLMRVRPCFFPAAASRIWRNNIRGTPPATLLLHPMYYPLCTHPCNGSSGLPPPCTRAQSGRTGCICSTSPCCGDEGPGHRRKTGVRPTGSPAQYDRDVCICGRRVRKPYPHELLRSVTWWERGGHEIELGLAMESGWMVTKTSSAAHLVVVVFSILCENITKKIPLFPVFLGQFARPPLARLARGRRAQRRIWGALSVMEATGGRHGKDAGKKLNT